jgi:Mg2+ and Co2+ transporter CorA
MRHFSLSIPLMLFLLAAPLAAQRQVRDPLTPAQAEEIAKAGIDPNERVHLYTRYLDQHADAIKALAKRADTPARNNMMAGDLEDLADLMDELGSNLDVYSDRKADIRKTLKPLNDAIQRWQAILKGLPSESAFDLARTDALDSSNDLADQARQMTQDLDNYFKEHKDQTGQEWHVPTAPAKQH